MPSQRLSDPRHVRSIANQRLAGSPLMLHVLEVPDSLTIERRSSVASNCCRPCEKLIEHEETSIRERRKGNVAPQIAPCFCGLQIARRQLGGSSSASRPQKSLRHTKCFLWCATENIDSHIEVDGHYYSAPHSLVRQEVLACVTRCGNPAWRQTRRRPRSQSAQG